MRIAINTRFLLADRLEGIGRFSYEVAKRLAERRPQDEFVFIFDRAYDARFVDFPNVEGVVVSPPARHPVLWYLWFEWAIPAALRKHKVDAFVSMDAYCSLSSKVPTLMVSHDIAHVHYPDQIPSLVRRYYDFFVPRYLKRAEQVVTVSHFCKKDFTEQYAIDAAKVSVACNGISPAFKILKEEEKEAVKQSFSQGQDYFFYVGAIHPRKNILRLIAAFDLYKQETKSQVKLLIAGRMAWQTGAIKKAYEASVYKADIEFLGYVSDRDLTRLVGASLALTYVSLFEGFGVPVVEAMQAAVPVITSNVSSLIEVGGEAAYLVDPRSEQAIAQAMQAVAENEELRASMIAKGLEHCKKFNWEKATDVVEQALERLC